MGNSNRVGVKVQQVCVLTYVLLIHDLKYIPVDHAAGFDAFRMHPGNELGLGPLWANPAGLVWKYNRCVS